MAGLRLVLFGYAGQHDVAAVRAGCVVQTAAGRIGPDGRGDRRTTEVGTFFGYHFSCVRGAAAVVPELHSRSPGFEQPYRPGDCLELYIAQLDEGHTLRCGRLDHALGHQDLPGHWHGRRSGQPSSRCDRSSRRLGPPPARPRPRRAPAAAQPPGAPPPWPTRPPRPPPGPRTGTSPHHPATSPAPRLAHGRTGRLAPLASRLARRRYMANNTRSTSGLKSPPIREARSMVSR
jgi:hypothetical protein